jgi:hypothetical protein
MVKKENNFDSSVALDNLFKEKALNKIKEENAALSDSLIGLLRVQQKFENIKKKIQQKKDIKNDIKKDYYNRRSLYSKSTISRPKKYSRQRLQRPRFFSKMSKHERYLYFKKQYELKNKTKPKRKKYRNYALLKLSKSFIIFF